MPPKASNPDSGYTPSQINTKEPFCVGETALVKGYEVNGQEASPSDPLCVAKIGESGLMARHFVKAEGSAFFNPSNTDIGMLKNYKFKQVSVTAFNLYLQFLKGAAQNGAMLAQAQREA